MMKKSVLKFFLILFAAAFLCSPAVSQSVVTKSGAEGLAEQEFRRGVQAFYRGTYNDAVLEFEKALSYLPGENLILDWLGRAYYMSGLESTALREWQAASAAGYGGLLLQNKIEIVRERRVTGDGQTVPPQFTEAGTFSGVSGDNLVFSQPVSVLPVSDGTAWVLSYGTNELLKLDVNGTVVSRITGPVNGFDRPVDVMRLENDDLLVSESAGDRLCVISPNGFFKKYIGTRGRGVGEMVGPQYLASDSTGNLYVTDFGNSRVDVFDRDGKGLFFFGGKTDTFAGLQGPTGIAVIGTTVYVADSVTGAVYRFDTAGNYLGLLVQEKTFTRPESLKPWKNYLLVGDGNRIVSIDTVTGATYETAGTGSAPSRITCAAPDINGNILATDFRANEIEILSGMSELVGGFFVQIQRVMADNFPNVVVELKVENRHRQPVVGLKPANFLLTEDKRPVTSLQLTAAASNDTAADITLVIDRSVSSSAYGEAVQAAVREIGEAMNGKGTLRIVSAGEIPVKEYSGPPAGVSGFTRNALAAPVSDTCSLDTAFRLAANDLINGQQKRSIIYITDGAVTQHAFDKYSLNTICSYLNNNAIGFSVVLLTQKAPADEIDYICRNTTGGRYYVYRAEGLSGVVKDSIGIPSGVYRLSFVSTMATDMGRKFLPLEAEVYLLNRSGRDESGYYAPLQ
jgi:DNA-binding beta-propeller fold protein YncE